MHCSTKVSNQIQQIWDFDHVGYHSQNCKGDTYSEDGSVLNSEQKLENGNSMILRAQAYVNMYANQDSVHSDLPCKNDAALTPPCMFLLMVFPLQLTKPPGVMV